MYNKMSEQQIANYYPTKFILLGDQSVGKSTICNLFTHGRLPFSDCSTIGVSFGCKRMSLRSNQLQNNQPQEINVRMWDTAGSERFRSIIKSYYRGTHVALLVFDLSCAKTFQNIRYWYDELKKTRHYPNLPLIVIIGCKSDLEQNVRQIEIDALIEEINCRYYTISCMSEEAPKEIDEIIMTAGEELHNIFLSYDLGDLPRDILRDKDDDNIIQLTKTYTDALFSYCC